MRRFLIFASLALVTILFLARPTFDAVDWIFNATAKSSRVPISSSLNAFHQSLWIADFHNDALLWNRNLGERATRGHVDLPRLREGGVDLAVFSVTTSYHIGSNYRRTPAILDVIPVAAVASHWPRAAWFSPYQRAYRGARELRETVAASDGRLRLIETRNDFDALLTAQAIGDSVMGAVLLLEGMHAVEGELAHIDALFAAGFRVFGIAHMFDNDVGGSAHGWKKDGLSEFGRRAVARIDALGGVIDLAHASSATIEDVLALTSRPVVVSHTGLTSVCPGNRNLSDDVVARIAARGGLIAIGFWKAAVCGKDAAAIARTIHRAVEVAGEDHVALGSDFDGGVRVPFDAAGMSALTSALLAEGLTRAQIRLVMGENQKRFLQTMLPPGP